ncbi:MAG TPA: tetratricopeptide repeat protein [Longimicrobium sp.]|jgi:tetratricopeptide (TPR) repeat protein
MTPPSPERPVEFRAPLSVPGGSVAGLEAVSELSADASVLVWRVLRSVLLWAAEDPYHRGALLDPESLREWEGRLLTESYAAELRMPLAVVVGELARGDQAGAGRISWACLCVTDWALARRATRTALAFAEAAALVSPEQPRYAWVAGRMLRTFGRLKESGQWLRRAVRVAVRTGDWEAHSKGLNSLGNTFLERGDYRDAARMLQAALRTARRRRLRVAEGENLHDLFVVHFALNDWAQAEDYARSAFEVYRQIHHERLPMLAHDVAYLWISRGYFARALAVLLALEPLMVTAEDRLRVLTSAGRAAGASGERETFEHLWSEAWPLANELGRQNRYSASALIELGLGASSLAQWDRAVQALDLALDVARERGEPDAAHRAEAALAAVRSERVAETVRRAATRSNSPGDALAQRMISSLTTASSAAAA